MKLYVRLFGLSVVALLLFNDSRPAFVVSAQQEQPGKVACPVTKVTCPETVYANDKLRFTAQVQGGDAKVTPTYNWTVSAGSIEFGQGTPSIYVSTRSLSDGETVTATVEVGGYDRECGYGQIASSCTTSVMKKPEARKLDEYGKLTSKEENDHLDKFTIELQLNPTALGYIIAYGGRASRAGDAQNAADKAKDYLVNKRGLDSGRIVRVNGGYREQPAIELWIVPARAQLPKPTPTIKK
jgi:hypothetical protein